MHHHSFLFSLQVLFDRSTQQAINDSGMPFQGDEEMNAANDQVQDRGFDWNGPNDRDNPRTWSLIRKIYHTFVPVAVAFEV